MRKLKSIPITASHYLKNRTLIGCGFHSQYKSVFYLRIIITEDLLLLMLFLLHYLHILQSSL